MRTNEGRTRCIDSSDRLTYLINSLAPVALFNQWPAVHCTRHRLIHHESMLLRNVDRGFSVLLRHQVITAQVIETRGEEESMRQPLWFTQLARERQCLIDLIHGLLISSETPQRPRRKTRHRDARIQRIKKRIRSEERRVGKEC